jgi:signal transduction histidine kinase
MNHNRYPQENPSTVNSAFTQAVFTFRHVPMPYFYLNPLGEILFANQHAVKLMRLSLTELINQPLDHYLLAPIQDRLFSLCKQTNDAPLEIALSLQDKGRAIFDLRAKITLDVMQETTITGYHLFIIDALPIEDDCSGAFELRGKESYQQLLEKIKVQTNFIHDFLHDLKTPLSTLSTSLYLLNRIAKDDATRHLQVMAMQIEHLKEMILAAAEYNQVAQFGSNLNGQIWSISELIHQASAAFAYRMEAKGIDFRVNPFIRDCHVMGDRTRLLQAFGNLFENAYRYTKKGSVVVSIHPDYERALLYIIMQDTGIGIPVEELPMIFDRFYRAENAKAYHPIGTGLGLNIVRQIVEQHNGEIKLFSRQNLGTSVVITLPLIL